MTRQDLLNLINEEIKLDSDQQINLVDIIDQATSKKSTSNVDIQEDWEKKAEEIRSELKKICIKIESKGLAKWRQTDINNLLRINIFIQNSLKNSVNSKFWIVIE